MPKSHGSGKFTRDQLKQCPESCILEDGVRIFHPEHVQLGDDVYVGHDTMLKAYYKLPEGRAESLRIGSGTWIGQMCFFHSAGGVDIGNNVGIGPCVKILTSTHEEEGTGKPILHSTLRFAPVVIEDDVDIGIGSIVLPGIRIGRGAQIGAGTIVTRDVPAYAVAMGNPARVARMRDEVQ